jgi:hypothetical protein
MGIREAIDRKRPMVVAVTLVVIAGAGAMIYMKAFGDGAALASGARSFFSDDEGKHWFVDSADKTPPFDHNGKTAYRARVFSADGGKSQFVGYLERYTPEAIRKIEAAKRGETEPKGRSVLSVVEEVTLSGTEIKKPGDGNSWVARSDLQAAPRVFDVKGANGQPAEPVMP